MRGISPAVAAVEELPVLALDLAALQAAQTHAGLGDAPSLLANVLAARMRQAGEKILEVDIAGIGPVELHGAPHEEARLGEHGGVLFARKKHVERRGVACELERR